MNSILEYGYKSAIALGVFYLFYWFVLRKDTHFRVNRMVLIASLILSIILPAIAQILPLSRIHTLSLNIDFSSLNQPASSVSSTVAPADREYTWDIWNLLGALYIAGAVIVLARLAYQAIYLHAIFRLSQVTDYQGFKIVSMDTDLVPFSYFNRIFIPAERIENTSLETIIEHEKSHLKQGHFIDLFLIQFISIFQWFNPFIWLFEKSLKEVHEYLADEAVIQSGKNVGNYQAILVNQALGGPVFILTHQFNKSLIKNRITMMKINKSPKIAKLKVLLLIPLLAGLLGIFSTPLISQPGTNEFMVKGQIFDRFSNDMIIGANIMIKDKGIGTISDTLGRYAIIVTGTDDILIISYVGYRTQMIPVGKNTMINVNLEPDIEAINFDQPTEQLNSDKERDQSQNSGEERGFVFTQEAASYINGNAALQEFIQNNIAYPAEAKRNGIEGTVLVSFTIDKDGKIKSPQIVRGLTPDLDNEALRIVCLIRGWKPGNQGGRPVATTVTLPVEFRLK